MVGLRRFVVATGAALLLLGSAAASQAAVIEWTITDGTFSGGGKFSGDFTFNTATGQISDWDISTTNSRHFDGATYTPGFLSSAVVSGSGNPVFGTFVFPIFAQFLTFTDIPLEAPSVVDQLTGGESLNFLGIIPVDSRRITGGVATPTVLAGVPEPAAWAMMLLGVFGVGAALRSRRCLSAATA
jgi:hypothetical protein